MGAGYENIMETLSLLGIAETGNKAVGKILISSHILDELSKIADTIGIIDRGAMLAEVSVKELTAKGIDFEIYYLGLIERGR